MAGLCPVYPSACQCVRHSLHRPARPPEGARTFLQEKEVGATRAPPLLVRCIALLRTHYQVAASGLDPDTVITIAAPGRRITQAVLLTQLPGDRLCSRIENGSVPDHIGGIE